VFFGRTLCDSTSGLDHQMKPVVILSTADFGASIWTNKQHIALRLAEHCEVYYIESLGLREPQLKLADIRRIIQRLRVGPPKAIDERLGHKKERHNLRILSPKILPWHRYSLARAINQHLLQTQIFSKLPKDFSLWTFSPVTYGLESLTENVIYHSVDLLHGISGIPSDFYLDSERKLIENAEIVVASSKGVQDHLISLGRTDVRLWENVADIELYKNNHAAVRIPRVIFAGNLTPSKVDFALLQGIADTGIEVALAGPTNIDGSSSTEALESLLRNPNINYLGVLKPKELATEVGKSIVGIIPYKLNEYTSGVFPMKVYEYLAAGLAVVSTNLNSLSGKNIAGVTVTSTDDFVSNVEDVLNTAAIKPPIVQSFESNSWDFRIKQILNVLNTGGR
jgi:teichuronic acid biosynthesis glycosyltransferase TuaH